LAEERVQAFVEIDARRAELAREIAAMHMHQARQEGHVELNIGGYRFETSVQTLRRIPHTFFDAYFSGRYAQDVCDDGSIFVDRDGEHFGHVLEYMRDGMISVAEVGAHSSVSLLRALKREFGFYCIELSAVAPVEPEQPDIVFAFGGYEDVGLKRTWSDTIHHRICGAQWPQWALFAPRLASVQSWVSFMLREGSALLTSVCRVWKDTHPNETRGAQWLPCQELGRIILLSPWAPWAMPFLC
jgi:hypothetical protein